MLKLKQRNIHHREHREFTEKRKPAFLCVSLCYLSLAEFSVFCATRRPSCWRLSSFWLPRRPNSPRADMEQPPGGDGARPERGGGSGGLARASQSCHGKFGRLRRTRTASTAFPLLPVGNYELEIAKTGFCFQGSSAAWRCESERRRALDIHLEIAQRGTEIQLMHRPPLVEAASPAIGDEIENRRVSLLPLNGRQFSQLALLAAGATPPYPNGSTQQFNTPALGLGFSVNGQRSERNNFSLDGVTLMEPFAYSLTVNPSIDAIREFRVVEDSYGTDQGVTSGAQVNIASRSGSQPLFRHGVRVRAQQRAGRQELLRRPRRFPSLLIARTSSAPAWVGRSAATARSSSRITKACAFSKASRIPPCCPRPPSAREISAALIPRRAMPFPAIIDPSHGPAVPGKHDPGITNRPGVPRYPGSDSFAEQSQCAARRKQRHQRGAA